MCLTLERKKPRDLPELHKTSLDKFRIGLACTVSCLGIMMFTNFIVWWMSKWLERFEIKVLFAQCTEAKIWKRTHQSLNSLKAVTRQTFWFGPLYRDKIKYNYTIFVKCLSSGKPSQALWVACSSAALPLELERFPICNLIFAAN